MRWRCALPAILNATASSAWRGPSRLDPALFRHAAIVRQKGWSTFPEPTHDCLSYPSAYAKPDGSGMRGFCNWLIPERLMVGQYPGQNPEVNGPTTDDVHSHIKSIVQDARVSFFCSLQSEIPPQEDDSAWERAGGTVFLPQSLQKEFPQPFTHYAPAVRVVSIHSEPTFLHAPIEDLSVPSSEPLQNLLLRLLQAMDNEERTIYLHCWGGRGRAGLVGACLVSLIYPELDATAVLGLVQAGYDTRAGAAAMPPQLSKSPQTLAQRQFVHKFVQEQQREREREREQ